MHSLDDKDRRLLDALTKNARASLVSLARDIGLSRSATHDRITRLEEKGVIAGYTIVRTAANETNINAYLTIKLEPDVRDIAVVPLVAKKSGVRQTICLAGDIDMLVYCCCHSMDELSALREDIASIDGVLTVHTRMVLNTQ